MIQLQIISKVLSTKDDTIITENLLTRDYFIGYEDEYDFIKEHIDKYNNVPDKATFLSKFPNIELVEVTESDKYLVDTIREEYLYYKSIPVVQKIADLLKSDANVAAEYMIQATKNLQPDYQLGGIDIVANAKDRFTQFMDRKEHQDEWFFTTGFEELDDLVHGIQREEELFVIFARTNQGKSWVLEKICTHIWQIGFNVGYITSEMSPISIGYRFDTLYKNFSNKGLMWGKNGVEEDNYKQYIDNLPKDKKKFIVATPNDFDKKITVSRLRNWIKQYKLDLIAIDGITYMTDERAVRGDSKTTTLTNISEDLMALSMEMKVPVLIVVQANRSGVAQDDSQGAPELDTIRDSDGISHNASKVLSIRQTKEGILRMEVKKQRFGMVGGKLNYQWNIDEGDFKFIPSTDEPQSKDKSNKVVKEVKRQIKKDKKDVF